MIAEWEYSANNLLHHFRAILRGWWPFKMEPENVRKLVEVDEQASVYIAKVCQLLENQSTSLLL